MKYVAAVVLLVGSIATVSFGQARAASDTQGQKVYLKLKGIDGKMYDVANMHGDVVLVAFGATWCAPCNEEIEVLEQLRQEYAGKPVRFLWVSVEGRQQVSDGGLRAFGKQHKMSFSILRDPTQLTYAQFSMRVRVPLVVFFDIDGNFAPNSKHFGMSDPDKYKTLMRAEIDRLLKMSASSTASVGYNEAITN